MLRYNGKLTDLPAVADEMLDDGDMSNFDLFEHENSMEESE
jgi:hypothetical protein